MTFGDALLSCWVGIVYTIGALCGLWLATLTVRLAVTLAARSRHRRRQQRGLDHLAAIAAGQEHGYAGAQTEAISMRDAVAVPRLQGITACPEFCDDLTSPGNPDACTCTAPCPRAWCTRRREHNPVPVAWEQEKERGWR